MTASIYEKCGGFGAVGKIVLNFYDKVLETDSLAPYFRDVDMARLIDHQTKMICSVMGGPTSYSADQLRLVHARHAIDGTAFAELVALLREALEEAGLDASDIDRVMYEVDGFRSAIVSR
jgi:hemoglobin